MFYILSSVIIYSYAKCGPLSPFDEQYAGDWSHVIFRPDRAKTQRLTTASPLLVTERYASMIDLLIFQMHPGSCAAAYYRTYGNV
jgi:hypothetical protein